MNTIKTLNELEYYLLVEENNWGIEYKGITNDICFFKTNNDVTDIHNLIPFLMKIGTITEYKFLSYSYVIIKFHNKTLEALWKLKN